MPEPFLEYVKAVDDKLHATWIAPSDAKAIFVAVAEDAEFTVNRRIFIMPVVGQAQLTVGIGNWYVRVGVAEGNEHGIVEWSGIHGPISVASGTPTPPTHPTPSLPILHSKPVDGGYRLHTGKSDPHVVVFEMGLVADVGSRFPMGLTKWKWVVEKGFMGWTDCWGLNYPNTYAIRASTFEGPVFPTDRIVVLGAGRVFPRVVCARTPFHRDFGEKQNARGDAILLQQRKATPTMKFASHGEYLRFQAALVRSGDDKARTVGPAFFSAMEEGTL